MKKLIALLFVFVCAFVFVGCKKTTEPEKTKEPTKTQEPAKTQETEPAKTQETEPASAVDSVVSDEFKSLCTGKKVYATTCGQADLATLCVIIDDSIDDEDAYENSDDLKASDVIEGAVVLLVVGGSNKGLGAAGTDVTSEANRASEFAALADQGKITLVVVHIGGAARRGDTSDPIIKAAAPSADLLLVVEGGNEDGYFTNVAEQNGIALFLFSKASKMKSSFAKLFE